MSLLTIYRLDEDVDFPEYGSEFAACFDLKAFLKDGTSVKFYNTRNVKQETKVIDGKVTLYSGDRMLVPTGIVFDLTEDQSLRIHPRSGLALKNGITVANCEGVVDADYIHETFVMLANISDVPFVIGNGMRIAQAEVVKHTPFVIGEVKTAPEQKTERTGGFGSTGV